MDIFAEQQYIVERLDGDYAYLKKINNKEKDIHELNESNEK